MIKPKKLYRGDKVANVCLSSGMAGDDLFRHRYKLGKERLIEEFGISVVEMPNALKMFFFLLNTYKICRKLLLFYYCLRYN